MVLLRGALPIPAPPNKAIIIYITNVRHADCIAIREMSMVILINVSSALYIHNVNGNNIID